MSTPTATEEKTETDSRGEVERHAGEWLERWRKFADIFSAEGLEPAVVPHLQPDVVRSAKLGTTTLHYHPFLAPQGFDWRELRGLEVDLSTYLSASSFVAMFGWPDTLRRSTTPGDHCLRHSQGFTVVWAEYGPLPMAADYLRAAADFPTDGKTRLRPEHWLLAGHVNVAFDNGELERPEVIRVTPLTTPDSKGHLWQIDLMLYGGVIRRDISPDRFASTMGVEVVWVRHGDRPSRVSLIAGVSPFKEGVVLRDGVDRDELNRL